MYIYTYKHIHLCVCLRAGVLVCLYVCLLLSVLCIYVNIIVCGRACVYIHIIISMYLSIYTYIDIYKDVCVHILQISITHILQYIQNYIYIHLSTYISLPISFPTPVTPRVCTIVQHPFLPCYLRVSAQRHHLALTPRMSFPPGRHGLRTPGGQSDHLELPLIGGMGSGSRSRSIYIGFYMFWRG